MTDDFPRDSTYDQAPLPPEAGVLDRHLAGEERVGDTDRIRDWIGDDATRATFVAALRDVLPGDVPLRRRNGLDASLSAADVEGAVARARSHRNAGSSKPDVVAISYAAGSSSSRDMLRDRGVRRFPLLYAAGGLITALSLVIAAIWLFRPTPSRYEMQANLFTTGRGQQATVRLADGSRMILGPATTVRVVSNVMVVTGEVYFSIAPHSDQSFTVTTANAEIHVLGTTFSVRRYPEEPASRVIVGDGKVSVRALASRHHVGDRMIAASVVTANTRAVVSDSGVQVTPGIDGDSYTGWINGRLEFDEVPLQTVVMDLGRAYGADIRVTDSSLACQPMTLTASVRTMPLSRVLEFVSRVAGARVTRAGNAYVLVRGVAARSSPHSDRAIQPEKQYGK